MSCHGHNIEFTEPVAQPVGQTSTPEIVELTFPDTCFSHYDSKLVPEIAHRTQSFPFSPLSYLPESLNVLIAPSRYEDVRILLWLHLLMF